MTLTMNINPDAVWDDGTPITVADFKCTSDSILNTPGSLSTVGYDKITSIEQGDSDKQVIVSFSEVYAPYKNLFGNIIKADAMADCNDVSADMADNIPFSAMPYKIESWSLDQLVLVKNDGYYGTDTAKVDKVVMVPKADSDTEIASLVAGETDFIFPQAYAGITDALADPNIKYDPRLRHQLRRPVLPAGRRLHTRREPFVCVQGRRLPSGVRQVDRPQLDPRQHLRPDLPGWPAAELRSLGSDHRPVVRSDHLRRCRRH